MKKFFKDLLLQIKAGRVSNEEELRDVVDQASAKGFVEESEREMIQSVFELGDTLVRELMVPRTEMVWIEGNKNLRQGLSLALRSGYTRIPVIKENLDNVIGIAYVKDLEHRIKTKPFRLWRRFWRNPTRSRWSNGLHRSRSS